MLIITQIHHSKKEVWISLFKGMKSSVTKCRKIFIVQHTSHLLLSWMISAGFCIKSQCGLTKVPSVT